VNCPGAGTPGEPRRSPAERQGRAPVRRRGTAACRRAEPPRRRDSAPAGTLTRCEGSRCSRADVRASDRRRNGVDESAETTAAACDRGSAPVLRRQGCGRGYAAADGARQDRLQLAEHRPGHHGDRGAASGMPARSPACRQTRCKAIGEPPKGERWKSLPGLRPSPSPQAICRIRETTVFSPSAARNHAGPPPRHETEARPEAVMKIAVDPSVLLDVLAGDTVFGPRSREALRRVYDSGSLLAGIIVRSELLAHFESDEPSRAEPAAPAW